MTEQQKECRICSHYIFHQEMEVESFTCLMGHFNYTDYGDRHEGKEPKRGSIGGVDENMPCGGINFVLNKESRWYEGSRLWKLAVNELRKTV